MSEPQQIDLAVEASLPIAERLFGDIRARTADVEGVSREPYGPGEQAGVEILQGFAELAGLEHRTDAFGNLYMTLPGRDRDAPGWIVGSHVDSVPRGGNFDGLAGVVAGLTAASAMRRAGIVPPRDVTVLGIRAEECSSWYGGQHDGHIGSRAALGLLPRKEIDTAINSRTGKTLAEHMAIAGFDPDAVGRGPAPIDPARHCGYLELHIEQGPVLEARGVPVGIVTGIRGAARARSCRCVGAYTHSGAVPREYRSDAVLATVELAHRLEQYWEESLDAGKDMVFTMGKFHTDAAMHALTKVPGETGFTIDIRSQDLATLEASAALAESLAAQIAARRRVRFELGGFSLHLPALMDPALQGAMLADCAEAGIRAESIPSGAGHDAQDFVHAGIRSAMIFVRNANGSHNPDEAMALEDFGLATRVLARTLLRAP